MSDKQKRVTRTFSDVGKHVAKHFGEGRRLDTLRSPDIEGYRATLPKS